ncbi:hypothetical protein AYI68_g8229 [Smittium mucronatum]|uniref:Uncharacterized protein n=1 Tax=Smittium mucronatum TaxID=133383 RepID=A0A1R0GLH1_9FUNG|nr:hypothetical protein AYI68_g8229 [Smittium mucronatum]
MPEYPFCNKELLDKGLLKYFTSVDDISQQQPIMNGTVIFVTPQDVYSVLFLISLFSKSENNIMIFTDEYQKQRIIGNAVIPQKLSTFVYEINSRLLPADVGDLISKIQIDTSDKDDQNQNHYHFQDLILSSLIEPHLSKKLNSLVLNPQTGKKMKIGWYSHLSFIEIDNAKQLYIPIYIDKVGFFIFQRDYIKDVKNVADKRKDQQSFSYGKYQVICPVNCMVDIGTNSYNLDLDYSESGLNRVKDFEIVEEIDKHEILRENLTGPVESKLNKISSNLIGHGFQNINTSTDENGTHTAKFSSVHGNIEIVVSQSRFEFKSDSEVASNYISLALGLL